MGVEREIVKHLKLCAALMSDPDTLNEYPEILANQFLVAKSSIETLNQFLVPRAADPCGCHPGFWLDSSIISRGVGILVTKTLNTHMAVVRKSPDDFPRIVREDMKRQQPDGVAENFLVREMKETNCMGSIVLLYYYLYWYLLLILMNKRFSNDAMYCDAGQLDVEWLISSLPASHDFLEFRHFRESFRVNSATTSRAGVQALAKKVLSEQYVAGNFMFSSAVTGRTYLTRKTALIAAYRFAIGSRNDKYVDNRIDLGNDMYATGKTYVFNQITASAIFYGMSLMGGAASEFESQDSLQKWADMDEVVQVNGGVKDGEHKKYTGKLLDVLSAKPYSKTGPAWIQKSAISCVFDHCSATLMMDVCRSFSKLYDVLTSIRKEDPHADVIKKFMSFILDISYGAREKEALKRYLSEKKNPDPDILKDDIFCFFGKEQTMWSETEVINTPQSIKPVDNISLWVDEFKSLYPCRHLNFSHEVNHKCFLWDLDVSSHPAFNPLIKIQHDIGICADGGRFDPQISLGFYCNFFTNSWIVVYALNSVTRLLESLSKSNHFRCASSKLDDDIPFSLYTVLDASLQFGMVKEIQSELALSNGKSKAYISDIVGRQMSSVSQITMGFSDILKHIKYKQSRLNDLVARAKTFKKYPAIMWPVVFGPDNNIASFKEVTTRMERLGLSNVLDATRGIRMSAQPSPAMLTAKYSREAAEAAQRAASAAEGSAASVKRMLTPAVAEAAVAGAALPGD